MIYLRFLFGFCDVIQNCCVNINLSNGAVIRKLITNTFYFGQRRINPLSHLMGNRNVVIPITTVENRLVSVCVQYFCYSIMGIRVIFKWFQITTFHINQKNQFEVLLYIFCLMCVCYIRMPHTLLAFLWKSKTIFVPLDGKLNAWLFSTFHVWIVAFRIKSLQFFCLRNSYFLATGMKNTTGNSIKTIELIWQIDLKSLTCSNEHDIPFS